MTEKRGIKRGVGAIYSWAADSVYDRVVVGGAFRVLGGNFNGALTMLARRAGQEAAGGPILDMPVGTAVFTVSAAETSEGVVVGCDIAEGMTEKTTEVALEKRLDNLVAVRADAHRLPFEDGSFPVVMCFNGLQVIPDLDRTVAELVRVLAPGGRLYIAAVSLAVSSVMPERIARRLPNALSSHHETTRALSRAGIHGTVAQLYRMGYVIEARGAEGGAASAVPPR
jgi:SAM-dependent methyltransferase